jgi:hypothetical protein
MVALMMRRPRTLSAMHPSISQLCALTCETLPAKPLTALIGNDSVDTPIAAPLGDKICCPVADLTLQQQICTQLQLVAAAQSVHCPWLSMSGLYRVIVSPDRRSAVLANRSLLEAIGQTVEMYESDRGAFAFPCLLGIVVVLPMHIVGYALAPDTEVKRQYGLTTIWHELAHAHALALDYWPHGQLRMPRASTSLQLASAMWHEFFADRHSHWPGFSCDFENQLVETAWQSVRSDPTVERIGQLLVNLAKAYGRLGAFRTGAGLWQEAFPQAQSLTPVASAWKDCAQDLDNALASLLASNASPDLTDLEQSSQAWIEACQIARHSGQL